MKRILPVPSDLDIAQAAELKPILEMAASLGLDAGRSGAVRQVQGQGAPGRAGEVPATARRASTST